jgi:SAM-dependent methyltransferase
MFDDPELAALYDTIYEHAEDTPFYLDLAAELASHDIVDLGCGTGRLALLLAAGGHRVTGADPSPQMLAVARSKDGTSAVRWVQGGVDELGTDEADLVVMKGHVAQFFVDDDDWRHGLHRIRRVLRPGGRLAFETRNPAPQPWQSWTPEASRRVVEVPGGRLETCSDVGSVRDGIVECSGWYRLPDGRQVRESGALAFRTHDQVVASLADAGLEVERVYGDFDRSPVHADCPELIYVACVASG